MIGGAGTYSAVGARLFSRGPDTRSVGWIIDTGTDFPEDVHSLISSWNTHSIMRPREGLTTRGWNGYGENESRSFRYLTEKKRITADDLFQELLSSSSFHLICSASRCKELVLRILERRREVDTTTSRPLFIWEPVPDLCITSELELVKSALHLVDILSPNHEELGALFGFDHSAGFDESAIAPQVQSLLESGIGIDGKGAVIVRAGKRGCFVASREVSTWLPPFHTTSRPVVDPTGGGNGFLGGFALGLVRTDNIIDAAAWGNVAASFCIEQVGPPRLTRSQSDGGNENWNGCDVMERLEEYRARLSRQS